MVTILPLRLEEVEVIRRGRRLLGPVTLELGTTGMSVLVGPNGSGKTTFLRTMHGLERISAGRISWACDDATARQRQAFVFQSPIVMRRSVVDCIAFPLLLHGIGRSAARDKAAEWAGRVGLGDALDRSAQVLSGGEKQKLALARALVRDPDILFLDEPCANLDGSATREIEAILHAARANGTRIVMSTHDLGQARRLADDMLFLYGGKVHETGSRDAFLSAPRSPEASAFLNGDLLP
jgi:tungstate transport system ATP-binding protein